MVVKIIGIHWVKEYINAAFENDTELIGLYDKGVKVNSVKEVCDSVYEKLESLIEPCEMRGIVIGDKKVGYFTYSPKVLTSFGLNKEYRTKEYLTEFWEAIKKAIGSDFQCALFNHNVRAIEWLEKCGMNIILENLTILYYAGN